MTAPKAITITYANIPSQLREQILNSDTKSGAVIELLKELVQLRLDRASTDALAAEAEDQGDQVSALRQDLAGAQGTIEGLRVVVETHKRNIETLQKSIHTKKEDMAMKIKSFQARDEKAKQAMGHALALINYFNPGHSNEQ